MQRRDFIVLAAARCGNHHLEGCTSLAIMLTLVRRQQQVPGVDYWRWLSQECAAGCGIIIRKRDGRVNKVDEIRYIL
jgi:hypothetical protein